MKDTNISSSPCSLMVATSALAILAALPCSAVAQSCEPFWVEEFPNCNDFPKYLLRTFDLGDGERLYSAGRLGDHGLTNPYICRREFREGIGSGWYRWSPPLPRRDSEFIDLVAFDADGTGPSLVALTQRYQDPDRIWRWTGAGWQEIGATPGSLWTAAVFDDGTGEALYVGGNFTEINGVPVQHLARWRNDGHGWEPAAQVVSGAASSSVSKLYVTEEGGEEVLYMGGYFHLIDGIVADNIARRDRTGWSPLGLGLQVSGWFQPIGDILSREEDGTRVLYVGGRLEQLAGHFAEGVARWDGRNWSRVGTELGSGRISVLASGEVESEFDLFAVGTSGGLHGWDGQAWQNIEGVARTGIMDALVYEPEGAGSGRLYISGSFSSVANMIAAGAASWGGLSGNWQVEPRGLWFSMFALPQPTHLTGLMDTSGPLLLVSGINDGFDHVRGMTLGWNGQKWRAMGTTASSTVAGRALDAVTFDDGSGPAIYGALRHCIVQNVGWCNRLGRWDGQEWVPVGGTADMDAVALAVFDDEGTDALYVATDDGNRLMRWDGASLSAVPGAPAGITQLAVFDDGAGPQLYASGVDIWRFDGVNWSRVGGGLGATSTVTHMGVFEYAAGTSALFIAGRNLQFSGSTISGIMRWDGQWSQVGEQLAGVRALASFDDGRPVWAGGMGHATLYAAVPSGVMAGTTIKRWDGEGWDEVADVDNIVYDMLAWDDGRGEALWLSGKFRTVEGVQAGSLARYVACVPCYANCDGSTLEPVLTVDDFTCFIDQFAQALQLPIEEQITHYANCDGATEPPILTVNDFTCFINAFAAGCL